MTNRRPPPYEFRGTPAGNGGFYTGLAIAAFFVGLIAAKAMGWI